MISLYHTNIIRIMQADVSMIQVLPVSLPDSGNHTSKDNFLSYFNSFNFFSSSGDKEHLVKQQY